MFATRALAMPGPALACAETAADTLLVELAAAAPCPPPKAVTPPLTGSGVRSGSVRHRVLP